MKNRKQIWIATYYNGIMPETMVIAGNKTEAYKMAIATYRYHSMMYIPTHAESPIVKSVRLADNQSVFHGNSIMPVSEFSH